MRVNLENNLGRFRECRLGFSWTVVLFGFFVPLFREDYLWCLILFGTFILLGPYAFWFQLVFGLFYNDLYLRRLLASGYRPATNEDKHFLQNNQYL